MFNRTIQSIAISGIGLFLFASCDSTQIIETPSPQENAASIQMGSPQFTVLREQLDASLIPNSIDDIFVRLDDRFKGFGGVYEDDQGQLVIVSTQPENVIAAKDELVAELFEMTETNVKSRSAYLSKEMPIKPAVYSFTELAVYRDLIEKELRSNIPLVLTDVDERQNVVVMGMDESANISTADVLSTVARLGIPPAAVAIEHTPIPQAAMGMLPDLEHTIPTMALTLTSYVRPLAGGTSN